MSKRRRRKQVAALPYTIDASNQLKILLVTSRDTGRWVLPKGWPMNGRTLRKAAQIEAFEEAGVIGKTEKTVIGTYDYDKIDGKNVQPCRVHVFPLAVVGLHEDWPERTQRRREWHAPEDARDLVQERDLKALLSVLEDLLDLASD